MTKKYPKILSNIPEGKDLFKVESHNKIANTIINIIDNQSSNIDKQIIGLEGNWGTGKSNIIKIIEENSKEKYIHFTYDTWTHQEDLTRKSIIIELINSLREKINSFGEKKWLDKENQLSQKKISKNTKHFPQIKLYYVFVVIGFIIIKFINETNKQTIDKKLYGFYDNSMNYLIDNFHIDTSNTINITYIFKSIPYLFFIISFILFIISFCCDLKENYEKEDGDSTKLTFWNLIGKSFYWISGEKLETNSDETISENEPSNLKFRNFLKDIDGELVISNKKLILTIDNTDRLSKEKLKSIWSTINIFFAESNNSTFLKNIWLIIPFDSQKVIESFDHNIGIGLLEKTFSITFNVPPPLISNWELFFEHCFIKSFGEINFNEKQTPILLRIYENYEKEITPRKIIIFINQLATYYIQNSKIDLKYFAIVILKKDILFKDSINENILDRSKYLENLSSMFIDDEKLELNLAKIIYGIENDHDAEEALLDNEINNVLLNDIGFSEQLLKTPSFDGYFFKAFKKFVEKNKASNLVNDLLYDRLTFKLLSLENLYIDNKNLNVYKSLWEFYYLQIKSNQFTVFNNIHQGIILHCSKKTKVSFINETIDHIRKANPYDVQEFARESQSMYLDFLKALNPYILNEKIISFKDLHLYGQPIDGKLCLDLIKENEELFLNFKIICDEKSLATFLAREKSNQLDRTKLIDYQNEIFILKNQMPLNFISNDINNFWLKSTSLNLLDLNALFDYYSNFKEIELDKVSQYTFDSLIELIDYYDEESDLKNLYLLIILNYGLKNTSQKHIIFKESTKFEFSEIINFLKNFNQLINVLKFCLDNDSTILKELSFKLVKENYIKLNNDKFNWLLENYSLINDGIFKEKDNVLFYNYLNKNYKKFEIDITKIDSELLRISTKSLNSHLIKESNNLLVHEMLHNNSFLQNVNTNQYKIFLKLLKLEKIQKGIFNENLHHSYLKIVINNNLPIQISNSDLKKIKSHLDTEKIKLLIDNNLGTILTRKKIYPISPEIFDSFDKMQKQYIPGILDKLVNEPDFYNIDLLNHIQKLGKTNIQDKLKQNLNNYPEGEVKKYAIEIGLIESSSN